MKNPLSKHDCWTWASFLLLLCLTAAFPATAQQPSQKQTMPFRTEPNYNWKNVRKNWLEVLWTGPDASYTALRHAIEKQALEGRLTPAVISSYRERSLHSPANLALLFQWACAVYESIGVNLGFGYQDLEPVSDALSKAAPPHSYEFTRIHFLVLFSWRGYLELRTLARRLLNTHPDDYDVQSAYIIMLDSGNSAERKTALAHAKKLVERYPALPGAYYTLANVYNFSYLSTNSRTDAENAITTFRRVLSLPATGPQKRFQHSAARLIPIIERNMPSSPIE